MGSRRVRPVRVRHRAPARACAVLVALATLTGCGDDAPGPADPPPSSAPSSAATASLPPVDLGDAALVPVTGRRLCRLVTPAAASAALGTEVVSATPSDGSTPQCTYSYGGDSSTLSSFTIAAQRPADVGGRGLQDAFDHTVEINRGPAAGGALAEAEVAVGDRAVSLTGDALTVTVVAVGDHLVTLVTTPDVGAGAVEELASVVVSALA